MNYCLIFIYAFLLRMALFSGFILCDDPIEFATVRGQLNGVRFDGIMESRFFTWFFNYIFAAVLGLNEGTFFLPSLIIGSLLPVIGVSLLRQRRLSKASSNCGGILLASAPFEVLISTSRANDLFLTFFLALALLVWETLTKRPVLRGIFLAMLTWCGVYVKVWAVFLVFPLLGWYAINFRSTRAVALEMCCYVIASSLLHISTLLFFYQQTESWAPFAHQVGQSTAIAAAELPWFFTIYAKMLFAGSEFGTTLFGVIPYLWLALFLCGFSGRFIPFKFPRPWLLLAACFALLVNFAPIQLRFDGYYLIPRIYRYLSPLSFLLTLQIAYAVGVGYERIIAPKKESSLQGVKALYLLLVPLLVYQSYDAHRPGLERRAIVVELFDYIAESCPRYLLLESWNAYFASQTYLARVCPTTKAVTKTGIFSATEYEEWVKRSTFPPRTLLVTGLASCVHYGCSSCGFSLRLFESPLNAQWSPAATLAARRPIQAQEPVKVWKNNVPLLAEDDLMTLPADALVLSGSVSSTNESGKAPLAHFGTHFNDLLWQMGRIWGRLLLAPPDTGN